MDIEKAHRLKKYWPIFAIVLAIAIITIIVIVMMKGSTTSSGGYPDPESTTSLACESNDFEYPIYRYDYSTKKNTVITGIFSDNKLSRISLTYTLYYTSKEQVVRSEAENHAAMNLSFYDVGLEADSFGANYRQFVSDPTSTSLAMTITSLAEKIKDAGAKYFMLQDVENKDYTLEDLRATYRNAGFICEVKN